MEKYSVALLLAILLISAANAESFDKSLLNPQQMPDSGMLAPNIDTQLRPVKGPFLELRGIMANPEVPVAGGPFSLFIVVANTGDVAFEGEFTATLKIMRVDSGDVIADILNSMKINAPLTPHEERRFPFEKTNNVRLPAGQYKLHVVLTVWGSDPTKDGIRSEASLTLDVVAGPPTNQKQSSAGVPLWLYFLSAILVAALLIGFVVIYYRRLKPDVAAGKTKKSSSESSNKLSELYKNRDEIEQMIKIAKVKYYKRTIDEESYREIVREHQNKLIEIEARISKMEGTIKELQGQIGKTEPAA